MQPNKAYPPGCTEPYHCVVFTTEYRAQGDVTWIMLLRVTGQDHITTKFEFRVTYKHMKDQRSARFTYCSLIESHSSTSKPTSLRLRAKWPLLYTHNMYIQPSTSNSTSYPPWPTALAALPGPHSHMYHTIPSPSHTLFPLPAHPPPPPTSPSSIILHSPLHSSSHALKWYSKLTRKGNVMADSILFSFRVCSTCFSFTTFDLSRIFSAW